MTKDQELYLEEQRNNAIKLNEAIEYLLHLTEKQVDNYKAPSDTVKIQGEVKVNTEKEVAVSNLEQVVDELRAVSDNLTKAIETNSYKPLDSVTVKNIVDAKASEIKVSNFKELSKYLVDLRKAFDSFDIKVEKQEVVFPRTPREAIPVRLSDGKSFYKAQMTAVSGGITEVDPLVGYQPSDKDTSTDPKYYGFVRKDGSWYIMEENVANGTYRYAWGSPSARGGGLYTDAWTDRANLTYGYFYEVY